MAQASKDSSSLPAGVDIATWELVCFCLYNDEEKRELLGNPRLPMRTIDEIFLCRAILGKLFLSSEDRQDLQQRLRLSGFSDDLSTLKVLPPTRPNVQEAHERALRTVKNSYKNNDEKGVNKEWYKNHSLSIEVLMLMTQNSMQHRLKRKALTTPEWDRPEKKRRFNEEVVLPGSVTPTCNNPPRAGCGLSTTVHYQSVPVTPMSPVRWESSPPWPVDLTAVDAVTTPVTIDITQSHDDDDEDDHDRGSKAWEEKKPPAVHYPSAQSGPTETEEEERVVPAQPVNHLARSSPQPIQPIQDQTLLVVNEESQDPEEESSMVIPTEASAAMVHYVRNGYRSKMHLPSVVISLAVWLIGFHVLFWSLLDLDQSGFWGEQYNPLRICFSIESMSRPKTIYPMGTMDLATVSDPNYGPWLERDDGLRGSSMMMMMTNTSMYLHRQCYPWYGAVTTTLGVLAMMWILSKLLYRVKA